MRLLSKKHFLICVIFMSFSTNKTNAQVSETAGDQDKKIATLIEIKSGIDLDRYRIQIFSGEIDEAQRARVKFKTAFGERWSHTVIYETPNYKVWVGHFKSDLAADRALLQVRKEFPNAFRFKPVAKKKKRQ